MEKKHLTSMKRFLKYLGITATIIAIVGGITSLLIDLNEIKKWFIDDPIVYFGEGNQINPNDTILLDFYLPISKKNQKAIIPFPLIIKNENSNSLERFHFELTAPAYKVTGGYWSPRLLSNSDIISNYTLEKKLGISKFGLQTLKPKEGGIEFTSNSTYKDIVKLNLAGNDSADVWDKFLTTLTIGAKDCKTKEYLFDVRCYFVNNPNDIDTFIKPKKKGRHFLIVPHYSSSDISPDSIIISEFSLDDSSRIIAL